MKPLILGVIGGLGPETSCNFCLNINNTFKQVTNRQPHILLDNLPISREAEERLIKGELSKEHFELLQESVQRFNNLHVNVIVIACNTVHIFIDELRKNSKIPILSIIEETAKKCKEINCTKVGLLGSTKLVQSGLHSKELKKKQINVIIPNETDQQFVSECILRIINHTVRNTDKKDMMKIIHKFQKEEVDGIILGCTDLPLLLSVQDVNIPIINTTQILEEAAINFLTKQQSKWISKIINS